MNVSKMASRRTRLSFKEKSEICELSLQADFDKEKIMDKYGIGKVDDQIYNLLHELDIIALQDKLNPATSNQSRITSFFENK